MAEAPSVVKIRIAANGPYIVRGVPALSGRQPMESTHGEPLAWEPTEGAANAPENPDRYALCRGGHSSTKPFCDGTHANVGFDGTLTADRAASATRREVLEGEGITLTDDTTLCADSGFCGTRLTNVWDMAGRTGDPEVRDALERMAKFCPSGRLEVSKSGGEPIELEFTPSIAPVPNGPLWVRGGIAVEATDGFVYEIRNRVTLCRCGESQNKPFCDGAHKSAAFVAP